MKDHHQRLAIQFVFLSSRSFYKSVCIFCFSFSSKSSFIARRFHSDSTYSSLEIVNKTTPLYTTQRRRRWSYCNETLISHAP